MKKVLIGVFFMCLGLSLQAQETLTLRSSEAEAMFLERNLQLIAQRLQIEQQQAEVLQAKLWPNPELSIGEINLWKNSTVESSPAFWGDFGKDQQVAFEISQLVQTAGKRKKLVAIEQVELAMAEQYFEDLLRALKVGLRTQLSELSTTQQSIAAHEVVFSQLEQLTKAYARQLDAGMISKAEYLRLKAEAMEVHKEIVGLKQASFELEKELKQLLRIPAETSLIILESPLDLTAVAAYKDLPIGAIIQEVKALHPAYKKAILEQEYAEKELAYQKALRVPDLTFGVNYDRNGSTMLDFVGVGVSFDLPVFDRNRGGIKKAELAKSEAVVEKQQAEDLIENKIVAYYRSLQQSITFLETVDLGFEEDLDELLARYTKNFSARNISMFEYLDFMEAYLNNKTIFLEASADVYQQIETLNYHLGKDL